ncbi:hypothetical protein GCM10027275_39800 [Rhabdobacter roseus]|uniref:HEAT repeat protein n=1 Tax=Rhabdobacter roseus TaxID=1655419 RepID=A0A840TVN9_9BACT|nr:cyclic nucleotide-binding domain-containing protein [Rhabdobacter roseus]MBB5285687.1 HEAT repeat protein [Rhabdobacter roseus]
MKTTSSVKHRDRDQLFLFFLHNFFISLGTIFVYVSANVILLENHPEYSLPIAYVLSTLAMMGVGKIYEYYEHHFLLKKLSGRVLVAVLLLVVLLIGVLGVSHLAQATGASIAVAVGIMVGYRVIYLLTNLEFWGVSALVFDVRQSKRVFSIIGSGDVPAKAVGAILTVLIHSEAALLLLLVMALGAFLLALYIQQRTFRRADVPNHHHGRIRTRSDAQSRVVERLFGGNPLVFQMCLGLVAVAAAGTWIEYNFFVNVKYKFHAQHDVITFIGYLLAITYSVSTLVKLALSGKVVERFGLRNTLLLLPVGTLLISLLLVVLSAVSSDEASLLLYFSAAYLCFEVLRRTVFDPVFLVMFQPLSTQLRLKGHTLAKGFYEPLGMGIAGLLLLLAYYVHSSENALVFGLTALFSLLGYLFLHKAYRQYLLELKNALSKRFLRGGELALEGDALGILIHNLRSEKAEEVLSALDWLERNHPAPIAEQVPQLLIHASGKVRLRALEVIQAAALPYEPPTLYYLATHETDPATRQLAAQLICRSNQTTPDLILELLHSENLSTLEGALVGCLQTNKVPTLVEEKLQRLCQSVRAEEQLVALTIIETVGLRAEQAFVKASLASTDPRVKARAIEAAGALGTPELQGELIRLLAHRSWDKKVLASLIRLGDQGLSLLLEATDQPPGRSGVPAGLSKVIFFCERFPSEKSRKVLTDLAQRPDLALRQAALKVLAEHGEPPESTSTLFEILIREELTHAHQLLHSYDLGADEPEGWDDQIDYELRQATTRLFYLLMLQYDQETVRDARRGTEHASRERRANALEILDNIIPRPIYRCFHALLDDSPLARKSTLFRAYLGESLPVLPVVPYVIERGDAYFGAWTLALALRQWQPTEADMPLVQRYLAHPRPLFREALATALADHAAFKYLVQESIPQTATTMHSTSYPDSVSEMERVLVLKNTRLFETTPENVLTAIAPIMKEVPGREGELLVKKGDIGTFMYIIYAGEVGIYDGTKELARFTKGDIFGELALLDAEPRSASAVAETDVLLFRIDQDDFYDLMEERSEVLRNVLHILCQRIRLQNTKLSGAVG